MILPETLLIVDLESTCWDKQASDGAGKTSEIIEIGAVVFDCVQNRILDELDLFVKPTVFPELSAFCTELTTITQQQVDQAELFPVAVREFEKWAEGCQIRTWGSWGEYDRNQFVHNGRLHEMSLSIIKWKHLNLKAIHKQVFELEKQQGLQRALQMHNLSLDGTAHRGIDDARAAAKLTHEIWKRTSGRIPRQLSNST